MIKALGNVRPRHLLDRRLNPPAEAAAAVEEPDLPIEPSLIPLLLNRPS